LSGENHPAFYKSKGVKMRFVRPLLVIFLVINQPLFAETPSFSKSRFDSLAAVIDSTRVENLKVIAQYLESPPNPRNWQIAHLLGQLYARQKNWSEAITWQKKLLELIPHSLAAHYALGIAYREQGIARDPFSRKIIWNNAKQHFETVIARDSTYKQVFLEYAWLKRYQNDFAEAIDLCLIQLKINPSTQTYLDIFRFYDIFLVSGGVHSLNPFKGGVDFVRDWLSRRDSPFDLFFLGELARRNQNYRTADSIYQIILASGFSIPQIPVYLARVRLLYETGQNEAAEATYWQAVESVTNRHDFQPIYEEMLYIFSDAEFQIQLKSAVACKYFCRNFWIQKNPTPAATHNIRLREHYTRLVYAEKNFRYDGFRLFANNPDQAGVLEFPRVFYENRFLNDKGLVYLRFGERNDWATTLGENIAQNESWLYYARGDFPEMIFHFEIDSEGGGAGCWRLVPLPTNYKMFESMLGWDPAFHTLYTTRSELEYHQTLARKQVEARGQIKTALEKEFYAWPKDLEQVEMYVTLHRFRTAANRFRAEVAIGIPREALLRNQIQNFILESGAVVYDPALNQLGQKLERLPIALDSLPVFYNDFLLRKFQFEFDAGKIQGATHIRQPNQNRLNAFKFKLDFTPLRTDSLACSDIEMAFQINPATTASRFVKNGLEILPNPAKKFDRNQPVYVYFEIYNLAKNESGNTYYEIEYSASANREQRNLVSKIWATLSRNAAKTISITNKQEGISSNPVENIALDFSQFAGKKMKLKITVRDLMSTLHCETATDFELLN
jgi:tetratricopeptide (TPR) repeat protein